MNITAQQYKELYNKLPNKIKEVINSERKIDFLFENCEKYDLEKYIYEIKDVIDFVLMGLITPSEIEKKIKEQMEEGDSQKNVPAMAKKISEEFIAPLKKDLENIYNTEIAVKKDEEEIKPKRKQDGRSDQYREKI